MSSVHRAYTEWSPDYFEKKAARHGNHVLSMIKGVLSNGDYPEIAYKRSMGIIQLHKAMDPKGSRTPVKEICMHRPIPITGSRTFSTSI